MKIFDFTEAKKARIAAARLQALRVMRAALIAAVAIVSGVLVVAFAGQALVAVGLWMVQVALTIAIGFTIGSIAYSLAEKLITTVWKPVIEIV